MAERPYTLTLQLMPAHARWFDAHPAEVDCVERFVSMMVEELYANDSKGNRPGWLKMDRKEALGEVHWHVAKLAVAAKDAANDPGPSASVLRRANHADAIRDTREFAADVANCALIVLDCMGLLGGDGG